MSMKPNGSQDEPDYQKLRLSDAFAHAANTLELTVDCYNINYSAKISSWIPAMTSLQSLRTRCQCAIMSIEKEATVDGCPHLLIKKMTV